MTKAERQVMVVTPAHFELRLSAKSGRSQASAYRVSSETPRHMVCLMDAEAQPALKVTRAIDNQGP